MSNKAFQTLGMLRAAEREHRGDAHLIQPAKNALLLYPACMQVKPDEWEAIPDIGDYTIKKRKTMQSFVPVPDTLLSKTRCSPSLPRLYLARAVSDTAKEEVHSEDPSSSPVSKEAAEDEDIT
eukprot:909280-Pelagomonas_calceolata.AAC.2